MDRAVAEGNAGAAGLSGEIQVCEDRDGGSRGTSQGTWPLNSAEGSIVHQAGERGSQKPGNKGPPVIFLEVGKVDHRSKVAVCMRLVGMP